MQPELQGRYNIAFVARAAPAINSERLQWALNVVAQRHAMLRNRFFLVNGEPRQDTVAEVQVPVEVVQVESLDEAVLDPVIHQDRARPFDLTAAPLMRASLYQQGEEACVLLLALDHLVCDAWSLWQLLDELAALLPAGVSASDAADVDRLPNSSGPSFFTHVEQQRVWLESPAGLRQFEHWRSELKEPVPELSLPLDKLPNNGSQVHARVTLARDLPDNLCHRLRDLAKRQSCSMFTVLLSGYLLLLHRLTGQSQLGVGSPMPARGGEWARTIGTFTNPVVLRAEIAPDMTVSDLLRQVQSKAWRALKNQHYPLSELVERLQPSRTESGQPYFQALFVSQKARAAERTLGLLAHAKSIGEVPWAGHQLSAFGRPQNNGGSGMDLLLEVAEIGDALMTGLDYDASRFSESTIRRWMQHWEQLLHQMTLGEDQPLHQLDMLPAEERLQVLELWNDTARELPLHRCVHELIEQQARVRPQAIAVLDGALRLSYAELNAQANRLAVFLRSQGVGPDVRVALCSARGADMLTALLAIWKAGGAYVPLDPGYPDERIAHMLADSASLVVLTRGTGARVQSTLPAGALCFDLLADAALWAGLPTADVPVPGLTSRHLAYVIYTSGSTGLPKGVMIEHRSLVNYGLDAVQWFKLSGADVVLQQNSLNFDLSIEEIVPAWLAGAALAPSEELFGLQALQHRPTMVHLTAAHWHTLVGEWSADESAGAEQARQLLATVRMVNVTGDALAPHMVQRWEALKPTHTELINTYGPTEITVSCSAAYVKHEPNMQRVSIGKPFANTKLYILDPQGQPTPVGVVGELFIGGEGVARGYLNRPELTAERFRPDPFANEAGARMYRTGDLARWREDGEVEFVGRNDFQVKVRGFRVELGEVEAQLAQTIGVSEVVVIARGEQAHEKRLVAYAVGREDDDALIERLKAQAQTLPAYMQPAAYVKLQALPKTPGGKLDRRALPSPTQDNTHTEGQQTNDAAQDETEQAIARIWCELLKLPQVGRHDNFFALGGHSLLAVQLVERMRRAGLQVQVRTLFSGTPTVAALAQAAQQALLQPALSQAAFEVPPNLIPEGAQRITPQMLTLVSLTQDEIDSIVAQVPGGAANVQDIYPLTHAQEGILFHHRLQPENDAYVSTSRLSFAKHADLLSFLTALQTLVDRHDALRTHIVWEGLDAPVQVVHRRATLEVQPFGKLKTVLSLVAPGMILSRAPLLRALSMIDTDQDRWELMLEAHHIILDNLSQAALLQEARGLMRFAGQPLPAPLPPPVPFRNLVAQARQGHDESASIAFFRDQLGDIDEPTEAFGLSAAHAIASQTVEVRHHLPAVWMPRLRQAARNHGVGLTSLLHLAWALVVAKTSGRDRVVFGTVMMGRLQTPSQAQPMIGMLINTLPLRCDVDDRPAAQGLRHMHRCLAELMAHEQASLGQALRCSGLSEGGELFNALFNYRMRDSFDQAQESTTTFEILSTQERSNYPLSLDVDDLGEELVLTVQVHPSVDAQRVCDHMQTAVQSLVEALELAPETPLNRLQTLPAQERLQVLELWNDTARELPLQRCVHELIEQQARVRPQAIAVLDGALRLSYAELNAQANRLAAFLRSQGVGPDVRVALCSARGADMLTALLAIWKAGGAYVPLDPGYPDERIAHMLGDSASRVVLTCGTVARVQSALPEGALCFDLQADAALWAELPMADMPVPGLNSRHLAYVIYTSGSTGLPKGVMVEHRSLVNYALDALQWFKLSGADVVLQQNSLNFDLSIEEIVPAWLAGAALAPSEELFGLQALQHRPTMVHLTAAHWHTLVGEWSADSEADEATDELSGANQARQLLSTVRMVNVTGDALAPHMVQRWDALKPAHTELINTYGPTEITVSCSAAYVKHEPNALRVSIGKPFANTKLYILDPQGQPAPVGVVGELFIGGEGVARGYLNRPELTAERFRPDPFANEAGARMYRTGDLARWREDGEVEFVGRNDFQVKVRGFRVELGEVEAQLAQTIGVSEVVVIARGEQAHEKRLVAYAVGREDDDALIERLKAQAQTLPAYMQPAAYVKLQALPKTPGGKLDRKALPMPQGLQDEHHQQQSQEPSQGETEQAIARIWCELLKLPQVGRHDNFFALGGHSLLAVQLVERMRRTGLQVQVRTLFSGTPTVATLAQAAQQAKLQPALNQAAFEVPPNLIPEGAQRITPQMLTLVSLTQDEIDSIVAHVPGGAANVQDIYPLTHAQEGILFHHRLQPENDAYVEATLLSCRDPQDVAALAPALQAVVNRHDSLRTLFCWEGLDAPVQVVARRVELEVHTLATDPSIGDIAAQLLRLQEPGRLRVDLARPPLLSLHVAHDPHHQRWLVLLMAHHIILDHVAQAVLLDEVQQHMDGHISSWTPPVPYRQFVARSRLGVDQTTSEIFFRDMLADVDSPTAPFGLTEVQGDGAEIAQIRQPLPKALSLALRRSARRSGVSVASVLHLAWAVLLARTCGQPTVVFGTVMLGRLQGGSGVDRSLGMFINTLPLRWDVDASPVLEGLKEMHSRLAELMVHENASLAAATRCSGMSGEQPLFSALLNYRYGDIEDDLRRHGRSFEVLSDRERSNYPLSLDVDDLGEELVLTVQVHPSVDAQRVCDHMQTTVQSLVEALELAPQTPLNQLQTLPAEERLQVLELWNDTARELPLHRCVHELIEQQARVRPQAIAVLDGALHLNYAELNAQANRLAVFLRSQGVGPDVRVALCSARGADMLIALLAIWKTGGAYVPLDPGYPDERIAHMLGDSASRVVLTCGTGARVQSALPQGALCIDLQADAALWAELPTADAPVPGLTSRHLAYVIYTSGSTGLPKGVMIEHRSLVNYGLDAVQWFKLSGADVVLQQNSLNFDLSIEEIVPAWLAGAALAPSEELFGLQALQHRPTMVHLTAAHWHTLVGEWSADESAGAEQARQLLATVRMVNVTGDALAPHMVQRWEALKPAHTELINTYGPTEITVSCSAAYVKHEPNALRVSIGKPFANTKLYILDPQGQPAPVGVVGELFIGGEGVARGYLNRPELTAERFVRDPFANEAGARMYRTGDLARWREDGEVEFVGRNDFQVKVRGFRVELGEVEAQLAQALGVSEVVVIARGEQAHEKRLVAYAVGRDDDEALIERLKAQAQTLPGYMQPAAYVKLQALPKTPGGKLDRKALPVPQGLRDDHHQQQSQEPPQGETEQAIARIWCELLKLPQVGRHDNFFALGGHSLLAVQLVERMRRAGLQVQVRTLFSGTPTVAALAQAAQQALLQPALNQAAFEVPPNLIPEGAQRITPQMLTLVSLTQGEIDSIVAQVPGGAANVQDIYPLTHAQEGMLLQHQRHPDNDVYLEATLLSCATRESVDRFAMALQAVILRHDILRTGFVSQGLNAPVQVVQRKAELRVNELALDPQLGAVCDQLKGWRQKHRLQLDMAAAPLMQLFVAADPAEDRWLVLMLAHHIHLDHVAEALLWQEVREVVLNPTPQLLPPVPFRNYVAKTRLHEDLSAGTAFFEQMLGDVVQPTAAFGLTDNNGDGSALVEVDGTLPRTLSLRLRRIARENRVSVASLMHLAWAVVLASARPVASQDAAQPAEDAVSVVFGTILFGRDVQGTDFDRTMGLCVNTLPLRVDLSAEPARQTLARVHRSLADLMAHEHFPERLASQCSAVAEGTPLFSSVLNYRYGDPGKDLGEERTALAVLHTEERSNYPLSLDVDDLGEDLCLVVQVHHSVEAHKVYDQMRRALQELAHALEAATEAPLLPLVRRGSRGASQATAADA